MQCPAAASAGDGLLGLGRRLLVAAERLRDGGGGGGGGVEVGDERVLVPVAGAGLVGRRRPGEALLELGEQGLVLLVQQLRLLAQLLVLLHDEAVLQVQLRVQPVHLLFSFFSLCLPATNERTRLAASPVLAGPRLSCRSRRSVWVLVGPL
jgi:hypothetical protein